MRRNSEAFYRQKFVPTESGSDDLKAISGRSSQRLPWPPVIPETTPPPLKPDMGRTSGMVGGDEAEMLGQRNNLRMISAWFLVLHISREWLPAQNRWSGKPSPGSPAGSSSGYQWRLRHAGDEMHAWLDEKRGADGWAMTPAGLRGVLNDAVAIYFRDGQVRGRHLWPSGA
jgi:hypothetical protein